MSEKFIPPIKKLIKNNMNTKINTINYDMNT